MDIAKISVIATSTVSVLSLTLNYLVFLRDTPRLRLSAFVGDEVSFGKDGKVTETKKIFWIGVTNIRRIPVIVKRIGFYKTCWPMRIFAKYFPDKFKEEGALLSGQGMIAQILYDYQNGQTVPRKLNGSDEVSSVAHIDAEAIKEFNRLFSTSRSFYVEDSTGRTYRLPWYSYRKLKIDFAELAKELAEKGAVNAK